LETQAGGELCRNGWKFLILLAQDFLFATAILCSELAYETTLMVQRSSSAGSYFPPQKGAEDGDDVETRERVCQVMSSSYIVWLQSNDSDSSREVKTVVAVLKHLLAKAQEAGINPAKPSKAFRLSTRDGGCDAAMEDTPSSTKSPGVDMEGMRPNFDPKGMYGGIGQFPL
jgi:hypothetical protein